MEENKPREQQPRIKDSNAIYFLVIVIIALLGTNAYLYYREKKTNDRVVNLNDQLRDEKTRMETEIDKIEAELDNANSTNIKLTSDMQNEQELARLKIASLREQLRKNKLTMGQLEQAQTDVKQLRYFVTKYTSDIGELRKQNSALTVERDSLKNTVNDVSAQADELAKQNEELNSKVKEAAALKVRTISVTPMRVKNNGKDDDVSKAGNAKKLRISFNISDNTIASKGMHDIFIRIIDPSGNLIIADNSSMFTADNEDMQYTYKTAIEFGNEGKLYEVDWTNPAKFQKGTYTIVLYSDGYTMGRTGVKLK
ncbi:hypothetical protein [Hufsiella ginkgonis]|uniref:Chromosome partitioning protein ParA n=1 Tax=Hufsiella ginkgonis TaxID=2695274 RepID=A0A7K1XU89_9SPHI|nr:hypothetical protein [Hufsiella ginkgonis]MXV14583.1 hypothetical protein [Hufsiella ginkgonis]